MPDRSRISPGAHSLQARLRKIISRLCRWYASDHRSLPWRETGDPYAIWISEVMLQQTQVATVLPYYERFMARFPTIRNLEMAEPDEVLRLWQGLGYYQRARHLIPAARSVVGMGAWPRTAEELAKLPGVGRSTAGAIASFAFGVRAPILDGNVRRVWYRLGALKLPKSARTEQVLWSLSAQAVRRGDPSAINQALMELGATLCLPKSPLCGSCILAGDCSAFALGDPGSFPPRRAVTVKPLFDVSVALLFHGDHFLVTRRAEKGLLGGLWELPGGKWEENEDGPAALHRELREELGIEVSILHRYPAIRHAYTHFGVRLHPFLCRIAGKRQPESALPMRWIRREDISTLVFPKGTLKIFDAVWSQGARRAAESAGLWDGVERS